MTFPVTIGDHPQKKGQIPDVRGLISQRMMFNHHLFYGFNGKIPCVDGQIPIYVASPSTKWNDPPSCGLLVELQPDNLLERHRKMWTHQTWGKQSTNKLAKSIMEVGSMRMWVILAEGSVFWWLYTRNIVQLR